MKLRRHKMMGRKLRYGLPVILAAQIVLVLLASCRARQTIAPGSATLPDEHLSVPIESHKFEPEHSPDVFLVMYDEEVGKEPLLKAIEEYCCEIVYDYRMISGMALKKPEDRTLEETMQYFRGVKGVTTVEYDHIIRLTDPVKPRLEVK